MIQLFSVDTKIPITEEMADKKTYPDSSIVHKSDKRNKTQVSIDFILSLPELINNIPSHCQQIQVTPILTAMNQHIRPSECIFKLLQRLPSFRVPLQLRYLELLQQVPNQLQMHCKLSAVFLMHPCSTCSFHNHTNQLHSINTSQLRYICKIPHMVPRRHLL